MFYPENLRIFNQVFKFKMNINPYFFNNKKSDENKNF